MQDSGVNNTWVEVTGATVDVNSNTISGSISHFSVYGLILINSNSSEKAITAFSLNGVPGIINETAKSIAVTMPAGTVVTGLVATFATTGANVKIGATVQTSGTTANNFTNPVIYTVTAADGMTEAYTVTVTVAVPPAPSSAKALTAFSFPASTGTKINEAAKTIAVTMPNGTNVTGLIATFITTGANVKVGTAVQTSGTTANNFTNPVVYTVTAADGTTAGYTVSVTVPVSNIVGKWVGTNNLGDPGWFVFSADYTGYSSDRGTMGTMSCSYSVSGDTVIASGTSTSGSTFTFSATVTGITMIGTVNEVYSGYSLPWSFNVKKQ